jgi:lipopolysaccharide export LptBFGC system permease protein LptF
LQFSLDDILSVGKISSEMTYKNLKKQISFLESNGINAKRWKVDLEYKIAYAFICFILVFCGIPISVYRSNTSLTQGIGISLGIVLSYIILLKLGQSLAYAGVLSPFIGVWLSNFIFLLLGIYLMLSARK